MSQTLSIYLADERATEALGGAMAACVVPGLVIFLEGDLGVGKTTVVRGLLRALGDLGPVKSPTYTLVELHAISGLDLYHFDFYRFNEPEEFLDAGLEEYFDKRHVCLVEWPQRAAAYLPAADVHIHLEISGAGRSATISAVGERGRPCLSRLPSDAGISSGLPPPA